MTTALVTYARVEAEIDQPIATVWPVIAAFGGLERWAAGVTGCTVEGEGVGAIRSVNLGSRQARERLEIFDEAMHHLRYLILPPHAMPADNVHGDITLTALDGGRTRMLWQSDASDFRVAPEEVGARIEAFYTGSIEGLKKLLAA